MQFLGFNVPFTNKKIHRVNTPYLCVSASTAARIRLPGRHIYWYRASRWLLLDTSHASTTAACDLTAAVATIQREGDYIDGPHSVASSGCQEIVGIGRPRQLIDLHREQGSILVCMCAWVIKYRIEKEGKKERKRGIVWVGGWVDAKRWLNMYLFASKMCI